MTEIEEEDGKIDKTDASPTGNSPTPEKVKQDKIREALESATVEDK